MNQVVIGSILDIKQGVIVYQVNCMRVAGAGLAFRLRMKYPHWYDEYQKRVAMLGDAAITQVASELYVADLYGQYKFGYGSKHTDKIAFRSALNKIVQATKQMSITDNVYIPYGIGCGLGGGDWKIIRSIIEEVAPQAILIKLPEAAV